MEDTADGLSFRLGLLTSISSGYDLDHFNDDSDDVSILWKGIIFLRHTKDYYMNLLFLILTEH